MAHLEARYWEGQATGLTRHDRRPCNYAVYLPDKLAERRFVLDGDVAADSALGLPSDRLMPAAQPSTQPSTSTT